MIQLDSKDLDDTTQAYLNVLQAKVDAEPDFATKAEQAKKLWDSKSGSKTGKVAFSNVTKALLDLCVFEGVCNYCEQNEANDIEHIHPKSFFPDKAFDWNNYLLACKQCNSGFKLDKCHVLDAEAELVLVDRGIEPPHKTPAMINPRIEDPNTFTIMSIPAFKFIELPELSKKDSNKLKSTLSILELNDRDTLIVARKSAAKHYYEVLNRLISILAATDIDQVKRLVTPYEDRFDWNLSLSELKESIMEAEQKYISTYQHPSVWHAIKTIASKTNDKWISIFHQIPEALNW